MDQEEARQLLQSGAVVLMQDVPVGTEVGIDMNSWNTGDKFLGIKMIPAGLHYIYYSAVDQKTFPTSSQAADGDSSGASNAADRGVMRTGPRTGVFLFVQRGSVHIWRWTPDTEELIDTKPDVDQQQRARDSLPNIDRFLGRYPVDDTFKTWVSLTSHITEVTLVRLQPESGTINSVTTLASTAPADDVMDTSSDNQASRADASGLPQPAAEHMIQFSKIPSRLFPNNPTPADVSKHSMDRSLTLDHVIEQAGSEHELLAELQFAFVCFLVGHVYEAFEHWKQLVHLICSCDVALHQRDDFYRQWIGVLHYQLQETPRDFFVDIVSRNNFLTVTLASFFGRVREAGEEVSQSLRQRATQFQQHLEKTFSWSFDDTSEDDAPVVVET